MQQTTKTEIKNAISEELGIPKDYFNLEKYFGDWYITGKLGTILQTRNTSLNKISLGVHVWVDTIKSLLEISNICCAKTAVERVDWNKTSIFEIK